VNVPVGIFGTYWSRRRLKEISRPAMGEKFDAAGAITFSIAITLLLLGLTLGSLRDFTNQAVVGASMLSFAIFIMIERKAKYPALDLSLFKIRLFTAGNIANLLSGLAFAALAFVTTLYFQLVEGYDPLHAVIFLIPLDVTLILVGPISGWLYDKWGARGLSTMGLLIASAGFFLLSGFTLTTPYTEIALWLALVGFGIGLFRSPNASSVMGSIPSAKRGISSGVRATIINTSIVASIPLVLVLLTADVPYSKLVSLGNLDLGGVTQLASSDEGNFLAGLQHSLIVLSLLILGSAIFSFLRGSQ
jgi:MFS family permease